MILARTRKGRGFSEVENREGWHGRALPTGMAERAIAELGGERHLVVSGPRSEGRPVQARPSGQVSLPRYQQGAKVATRLAFGQSLAAVGAQPNLDEYRKPGSADGRAQRRRLYAHHPRRIPGPVPAG